MKKALTLIVSVILLLIFPFSLADPMTLHVEKSGYMCDLTISGVWIEEGNLLVDFNVKNNDNWSFSYQPPLAYALSGGKKYEVTSYSATFGGSSSGGMILQALTYTIPYGPSDLPDEIYAEAKSGDYRRIWTIADAAFTPAAIPEGTDEIEIQDDGNILKLTILDYGFTGESQTGYSVTLDGYNFLNSGKAGVIEEIMPFELAIAWSRDNYLTHHGYVIRFGENVTEGSFEKEDGSAFEEPLYIIVAPKGTEVRDGYFYVLSEGKFHLADEVNFGQ